MMGVVCLHEIFCTRWHYVQEEADWFFFFDTINFLEQTQRGKHIRHKHSVFLESCGWAVRSFNAPSLCCYCTQPSITSALLCCLPNRILIFLNTLHNVTHWNLASTNPYLAHIFLYIIPASWLCPSVYAVPASILHLVTTGCTALSQGDPCVHLHLGSCQL